MLLRAEQNGGCTHCRSGANASEAKTSRQLLEHAGRSSKALGAPRLSVRLIDYEVSLQSHARRCRTFGSLPASHDDTGNLVLWSNIVLQPCLGRHPGASNQSVTLQYAGPNPVAFDIANHWCEYGADYHTDAPHLLDYSRMPQEHQQVMWPPKLPFAISWTTDVAFIAAPVFDGLIYPMSYSFCTCQNAQAIQLCLDPAVYH